MKAFATVYRYWLTLLLVAVVAQIAGAAYGAFYTAEKVDNGVVNQKTFDHGFGFHTAFGYLIFLGGIILLLLALAARSGKRRVLFSLAVPVAVALQIVLAWISESTHAVGILHGLNALVIFGLVGYMTGNSWHETTSSPEPSAAIPPVSPTG